MFEQEEYVNKIQVFSPAEKKQELLALFDLIPNRIYHYSEVGDYTTNIITGELLETPGQYERWLERVNRTTEARRNSELRVIAVTKFSLLLASSFLTRHAQEHFIKDVDRVMITGIDKPPYPPNIAKFYGDSSEALDHFRELFLLDDPNNGGAFEEEFAQKVDSNLFKEATLGVLNKELWIESASKKSLTEDEEGDSEEVRNAKKILRSWSDKISEEDRQRIIKQNEEEKNERQQNHDELRKFFTEWRIEHIDKFNDEP